MRVFRPGWCLGFLVAAVLLGGCQSGPERRADAPAATQQTAQPTDVIAGSDAERARRSIEQNQREQSGARRPAAPQAERPVDQPPVRR